MQTTKKTNVHNEEVGAEDLPVWTIWNHAPSTIRWNFRLKTQREFLFFFCPTEPNFFSLPIHVQSVHEISTHLNAADCDCAVRMKTASPWLSRSSVGTGHVSSRAWALASARYFLSVSFTLCCIHYFILSFSFSKGKICPWKRAGLGIEGYSLKKIIMHWYKVVLLHVQYWNGFLALVATSVVTFFRLFAVNGFQLGTNLLRKNK